MVIKAGKSTWAKAFLAEATSALNAHSEKYVQMALDNASKGR